MSAVEDATWSSWGLLVLSNGVPHPSPTLCAMKSKQIFKKI
jgi:hypothetical protein